MLNFEEIVVKLGMSQQESEQLWEDMFKIEYTKNGEILDTFKSIRK